MFPHNNLGALNKFWGTFTNNKILYGFNEARVMVFFLKKEKKFAGSNPKDSTNFWVSLIF
jgi:hypothetical protein